LIARNARHSRVELDERRSLVSWSAGDGLRTAPEAIVLDAQARDGELERYAAGGT
jgi:hypothetical protein